MSSAIGSDPVPRLMSLAGRTILVIGGGRGLGAGGVLGCLEAGARVVVLDILPEPCEPEWSIAQKVAGQNGTTLSYGNVDVMDQAGLTKTIAGVFAAAPSSAPVMGLFVTAGINAPFPAKDVGMDVWDKVYAINVRGSMLCSQAFANEWIKRHPEAPPHKQTASIVLTASLVAHAYNRLSPSATYASTKGAVKQMASALGAEWGVYGIRVNSISPGYVQTAMTLGNDTRRPGYTKGMADLTAIKRVSTPDEFKAPVVFLLSQGSSFVTATDLLIDGGHAA